MLYRGRDSSSVTHGDPQQRRVAALSGLAVSYADLYDIAIYTAISSLKKDKCSQELPELAHIEKHIT